MPISSRRCGMITKREAERLCKSFLGDNSPPKLPENFAFEVRITILNPMKNYYEILLWLLASFKYYFLTFRYTTNAHGDAVDSLSLQDTTLQELSVSSAHFVLFSFPRTNLSSILIGF